VRKTRGGESPATTHAHAATQSEASVSGRVVGQILRGSLQQKRKDEGPRDSMSFEEAVVAAIDFHGTPGLALTRLRPRLVAASIKAVESDLRRHIPIPRR
jgi:hypothetical protein